MNAMNGLPKRVLRSEPHSKAGQIRSRDFIHSIPGPRSPNLRHRPEMEDSMAGFANVSQFFESQRKVYVLAISLKRAIFCILLKTSG